MTEAELADLVALIRDVGRTEIMTRFRRLGPGDVHEKTGPLDLATVADEAGEAALAAGLRRLFPGCVVVGEEAASADPARLDEIAEADLCCIIDPIDGTFNYAAGVPMFGIMVAVVQRGQTVGAVIHDPVMDDTATALAGSGAWLVGRRLRVAAPAPANEMAGNVSWRFMPEPMRSTVCARLPRLGGAWDFRCAAHQYRMAAAGSCHFLVFHRLLPWDHAAGVLLHTEAGGYSARLDGTPYSPARFDGGLICAPDRACWEALRGELFNDLEGAN